MPHKRTKNSHFVATLILGKRTKFSSSLPHTIDHTQHRHQRANKSFIQKYRVLKIANKRNEVFNYVSTVKDVSIISNENCDVSSKVIPF